MLTFENIAMILKETNKFNNNLEINLINLENQERMLNVSIKKIYWI